jgi:hypothetical protein
MAQYSNPLNNCTGGHRFSRDFIRITGLPRSADNRQLSYRPAGGRIFSPVSSLGCPTLFSLILLYMHIATQITDCYWSEESFLSLFSFHLRHT